MLNVARLTLLFLLKLWSWVRVSEGEIGTVLAGCDTTVSTKFIIRRLWVQIPPTGCWLFFLLSFFLVSSAVLLQFIGKGATLLSFHKDVLL